MKVRIGNSWVGDDCSVYIIGEIGINHNGEINLAKRLISLAYGAGCNAIKFQKRTVDVVYSPEELAKYRETPFGETNGDLKYGLEFGETEYKEIDTYCKNLGIDWFASCWDEGSVDFIDAFDPVCYKIASASLTDHDLLRYTRSKGKPIILSTGMSTLQEIDEAVDVLGKKNLILFHTTSTYPSSYEEMDLRVIPELRKRYNVPIGYSGHETGLATSSATVALGVCSIERHITLDRAMWGSDQAASLGPSGLHHLVRDVRLVEVGLGNKEKRLHESEIAVLKKLRRIGANPEL